MSEQQEQKTNYYSNLDDLKDYWKHTYRRAGLGYQEVQSKELIGKKGVTKSISKKQLIGDIDKKKEQEKNEKKKKQFEEKQMKFYDNSKDSKSSNIKQKKDNSKLSHNQITKNKNFKKKNKEYKII